MDLPALRGLTTDAARQLEADARDAWLWKSRHAKLVDGFTFTMPDTPANQEAFPQETQQAPGVGFPIARACTIQSLATGSVRDPYGLWIAALARIARNVVSNRPGRIEPRAIKRSLHRYPLLHCSRRQLREEMRKT